METVGTLILWVSFALLVIMVLILDLGVFHRSAHQVSLREAGLWSLAWLSLALLFNVVVFAWLGATSGLEFATGYLVELALSVDNLFVFVALFAYFGVPRILHHRVLFWGILGAVILRAIFIGLGTALLLQFHWIIYIFGSFLVLTGIKFLVQQEAEVEPERNPIIRLFKRVVPLVSGYRGSKFFVRQGGRYYATPLALVLLTVEITDLVFAVDSIPAVLAVTKDPFIVFTSNIFAILGLRSIYFLLAGIMGLFHYLKIGLAVVLMFVGVKMLLSDVYHISVTVSLAFIAASIGGSIVMSLLRPLPEAHERQAPDPMEIS
jgi:tellurite resistance protein TerC